MGMSRSRFSEELLDVEVSKSGKSGNRVVDLKEDLRFISAVNGVFNTAPKVNLLVKFHKIPKLALKPLKENSLSSRNSVLKSMPATQLSLKLGIASVERCKASRTVFRLLLKVSRRFRAGTQSLVRSL